LIARLLGCCFSEMLIRIIEIKNWDFLSWD
jgi:hypothetical protein